MMRGKLLADTSPAPAPPPSLSASGKATQTDVTERLPRQAWRNDSMHIYHLEQQRAKGLSDVWARLPAHERVPSTYPFQEMRQ
jgi:hypothetical protein